MLSLGFPATASAGKTRVTVAATETSDSANPYSDSNSLMYGVWCHVYGCLIDYDFTKGDYVGNLARSWEVKDPNTWIFHLRDLRWQNGAPLTAADVLHSFDRTLHDPHSKQAHNLAPVAKAEAIDDHTVKVVTKKPTAPLLSYLDKVIITNKAVYDKYGAAAADRDHPVGAGPYKLARFVSGQMFALAKNPDYPGMKDRTDLPDEVVYRIVREAEARVVGLMNNEFQIIQRILPQLIDRVANAPNTHIVTASSFEFMFLGMSPKHKPWDNKKLRQAVCYAIDRDAIIDHVLGGKAERLDGVIGPGQYGYQKPATIPYKFDPAKAKALVKAAGYPDGVDVDLYTSTGRYLLDKTIVESMVPMLKAVGIRATLHTPEDSTYWANIQVGKVPFYYWGRQSVVDPSPALRQYFETGGSPRLGFSNAKVDKLLEQERVTFDPVARKKVLNEAFAAILEEAPACFLWRYKMIDGVANGVKYTPRPDDAIIPTDIRMVAR
jgi:peptide/nickel transport system substrate-binding protein